MYTKQAFLLLEKEETLDEKKKNNIEW